MSSVNLLYANLVGQSQGPGSYKYTLLPYMYMSKEKYFQLRSLEISKKMTFWEFYVE